MRRQRGVVAVMVALAVAGCGTAKETTAPEAPPPTTASTPPAITTGAPPTTTISAPYAAQFRALEQQFGGRLGVYAVDTGNGQEVAYNPDLRFAYASTFKALASGAVLRQRKLAGMNKLVRYSAADLLPNSPITEKHVGTGMTLAALCDAAIRYSDNAAANLLFAELGGPKALDGVLRDLGDDVTRMERVEPALSEWDPKDTRDTSTARAFAKDLRAFVLGDALDAPERAQLTAWLKANTTGAELIRAGFPKGWVIGDKTGTAGTYGGRNDIAVIWPPGRAPLVIAVFSHRNAPDAEPDNRFVAAAAKVVASTFS
ncbi:class A beta-lactamase [Kribbella sp. NPDC051770]|uniref:class A beta-lactamase n=1 Tax=Kribbella sp. NPDC051770 TaxID=3155413 RepID=UPI00342D7092